jgi:hypothetical protein
VRSDVLKEDYRLFESRYRNGGNRSKSPSNQKAVLLLSGLFGNRTSNTPNKPVSQHSSIEELSHSDLEAKFRSLVSEIMQSKDEFDKKFERIKGVLGYFEKKTFDNNVELLLKLFIHEVSYLKNMEYDLNHVITVD